MQHFARKITVTTSPTLLLNVKISELHNFAIYPSSDIEVGTEGMSYGDGEPCKAGVPMGYTWRDFNPNDSSDSIVLYGVCETGTADVIVHGWRF